MESLVTGLFAFRFNSRGEDRRAVIEITSPGILKEHVVRIVRAAWGSHCEKGVSQNRIECLGWERIETPPAARRIKAGGREPVLIWECGARPNEGGAARRGELD